MKTFTEFVRSRQTKGATLGTSISEHYLNVLDGYRERFDNNDFYKEQAALVGRLEEFQEKLEAQSEALRSVEGGIDDFYLEDIYELVGFQQGALNRIVAEYARWKDYLADAHYSGPALAQRVKAL